MTIDHTKVPSAQSNFTILVSVTDAALKTVANGGHVANANGYDIGFYSDSGGTIKLKWEVEKYDGTTGQLIAWVKIPSVSSSSDTVFYLIYGDSSINTDQSDPPNTWDSNFKAVYHLDEATGSTSKDSTGSGYNCTPTGNPTQGTGEIKGALTFNGSTQYVSAVNPSGMNFERTDPFTVSYWAKPNTASTARELAVSKIMNTGPYTGWNCMMNGYGALQSTGVVTFDLTSNPGVSEALVHTSSATNMNDGNWHLYHFTSNGSSTAAGLKIYEDGIAQATTTQFDNLTASIRSTADFDISGQQGGNLFNGAIDEVHVAAGARSQDWVATEYNNQSSPGTFIAMGSESCPSATPTPTATPTATSTPTPTATPIATPTPTPPPPTPTPTPRLTPTPAPGQIILTARGYKVRGRQTVDLSWTGATSSNVDIYRNGAPIVTTLNDGFYTDSPGGGGHATYTYQVCNAGSQTCSNQATVKF